VEKEKEKDHARGLGFNARGFNVFEFVRGRHPSREYSTYRVQVQLVVRGERNGGRGRAAEERGASGSLRRGAILTALQVSDSVGCSDVW
jgi:hypothetical protein